MSSLKSCPFCGSFDVRLWRSGTIPGTRAFYAVECSDCEACIEREEKRDVETAWNMRVKTVRPI